MKRKIAAGNWKMNKTREEAVRLIAQIESLLTQVASDVEVYVFPPFPHLGWIDFAKYTNLNLGAQDCSDEENGAFTGEVSAAIIASFGAKAVIIGHASGKKRICFVVRSHKHRSRTLRCFIAWVRAIRFVRKEYTLRGST